jgi:signal transduction histidine kinase
VRRFLRATYGSPTWGRLLFAALAAPLGALGYAYMLVVLVASVLMLVTLIGLPVLAAGLLGCRGAGAVHRGLARSLLGAPIERPPPLRPERGPVGWIRTRIADPTAWRAALYLLAKLPLGAVAGLVTLLFWGYGAALLAYPVWGPWSTNVDAAGRVHHGLSLGGGIYLDTWPGYLAAAAAGLAVLVAAPWVVRAAVWPDQRLAGLLLGPSRSGRLREARALAVEDSAAALRRIERDLHDGAQAQLVALAMKLSLAREELSAGETAVALDLVDTAHREAKRTLVELRDLARGIHPPILDAGLAPALETLVARGPIQVRLGVDLPAERPSPAIETIAYFTAAELLANVAKHSGADAAAVTVAASRPGRLALTVRDAGAGGARIVTGGGLAGLADRVRSVDGSLTVDSPPGGPTVVTVELPVRT